MDVNEPPKELEEIAEGDIPPTDDKMESDSEVWEAVEDEVLPKVCLFARCNSNNVF
ncbi:hypothetical protein KIN20_032941 [Parelaphostrongylus tenuis]|uniref:Uncharacterized protein n=1 Tax=Parelaphostrongylus tenuis TaxID=148309 RepID=A0AAD5R7X0_PARTN|nr:hypothetical protein KIN20_032941 [Parelaphostrongylus tenuis]